MIEEWKDIPGYEGYYQVSNHGRVKSLSRQVYNQFSCRPLPERIMRTGVWLGYEVVWFKIKGCRKKFRVHRLVAMVFLEIPEEPDVNEVNHKDKNRLNNHVSNLEWLNHIDNCAHRDNDEPF